MTWGALNAACEAVLARRFSVSVRWWRRQATPRTKASSIVPMTVPMLSPWLSWNGPLIPVVIKSQPRMNQRHRFQDDGSAPVAGVELATDGLLRPYARVALPGTEAVDDAVDLTEPFPHVSRACGVRCFTSQPKCV